VDHAEYATAGPFTELTADQIALVRDLGDDPLGVCRAVQGLLVGPGDAAGAGLSDQRMAERNTRPAASLLARALELDASPLDRPRPPEARVVGTCRHYAVLATAFLRALGVPARARCGFAAYFVPPRKVDHWIVEHWSDADLRWRRTDPEWLDRETPEPATCDDLLPGEFLAAGEAWLLVRSGRERAVDFGVFGTENWGAGEIRANAMRDLASVVAKVEMLPWDEWGPMADSYEDRTGDDFDRMIDRLADAVRDDERSEMQQLYDQLAVPPSLIA
jgi:Transglutaminase-like superfamily